MPKITTFNRETCRSVSDAVRKALEEVAKEYGLAIEVRGGSFGPTNFRPTVEFALKAADGTVLSREAEAFRINAHLYGLKPEHLGATLTWGGRTYKISGLASSSRKRPILAVEPATGKTFKFVAADIARLLALQAAAQQSGGRS